MDVDSIWSSSYGALVLRIGMSRIWFRERIDALIFDYKATCNDHRANKKSAPIREFEVIPRRHYIHGTNITINEQLVPFHRRCWLLQYLSGETEMWYEDFLGCRLWNTVPLACIPSPGKEGRILQVGLGKTITHFEFLHKPQHQCRRFLFRCWFGNGTVEQRSDFGGHNPPKQVVPSAWICGQEYTATAWIMLWIP